MEHDQLIGVDIGGTAIKLGRFRCDGSLLQALEILTPQPAMPGGVTMAIAEAVQALDPDRLATRVGIGHPGHKDAVAGYVLHDFSKADREWLDPLLDGISDGAAALASGDTAGFLNLVALRVSPPRKTPRAAPEAVFPAPAPVKPLEDPAPSPLSALQKLAQRFRP